MDTRRQDLKIEIYFLNEIHLVGEHLSRTLIKPHTGPKERPVPKSVTRDYSEKAFKHSNIPLHPSHPYFPFGRQVEFLRDLTWIFSQFNLNFKGYLVSMSTTLD